MPLTISLFSVFTHTEQSAIHEVIRCFALLSHSSLDTPALASFRFRSMLPRSDKQRYAHAFIPRLRFDIFSSIISLMLLARQRYMRGGATARSSCQRL